MDLEDLEFQCAVSDYEFAKFYSGCDEKYLREMAFLLLNDATDEDFNRDKIKSIAEFQNNLSEKQKYCLAKFVYSYI